MYDLPIQLAIPLFLAGTSGVPTTTTDALDLAAGLTSYEHTISDSLGFESITVERAVTVEQALAALAGWLMRSTVVSGPDGETLAEGYLTALAAEFGDESRSIGLDGVANRVTVKYTSSTGAAATTPTNHATSQALYGVKATVQAFEATDATDAANKAARVLYALGLPRMQRGTRLGTGKAGQAGATLRLTFAGWGTTLDWLTTSNTSTATAATDAQIASLLTSARATNAFLSSDQSQITASGVSAPQTIAGETTYRRAIEDRVASGTSSGQPLVWGVYEDRVFALAVSAAATPDTVTYRRALGDGHITDAAGNAIPWWRIRPNAIYEVADLLDPAPIGTAPDAAARGYISRVTFSVDPRGMRLSLEGPQGESVDKILARVR